MNKFLRDNEYVVRVFTSLIILVIFVSVSAFSIFNTIERNKQHDINMTKLNHEIDKQRDLRIKEEILYDEITSYYNKLKK